MNVNNQELLEGIFEILNIIEDSQIGGTSPSLIRNRCNISGKKLMNYLEKMEKSNLIDDSKAPRITRKGTSYLRCYSEFNKHMDFIKEKYFSKSK